MPIPSWPGTLPTAPEPSGYTNVERDAVLRSEMGYGPAKLRQRTSVVIRDVTMHFFLDNTDMETLNDFYTNTLERTQPFSWINHLTGDPVNYRFIVPPTFVPFGSALYWDVTIQLEIVP